MSRRRFPGEDYDDYQDRVTADAIQNDVDDKVALMAAQRAAAGMSPELLSLIDAANAGRAAGMHSHGASLNPYSDNSPEFQEWERHRLATISARLAGKIAA